jgi:hypothetical protein
LSRPRLLVPALACLALVACTPPGDREARTDEVIRSWVPPIDRGPWSLAAPTHPVAVYADRSGSMAGFLDPAFPTRTDYRSVIDGLKARLAPQVVYGFGTSVRREPHPDLGVMDERSWYGDRNTETEQVLDSIAADSLSATTHLIVTDGRRTEPTRGYGQFERMRDLAQHWISRKGTFLVAVSLAPFTPVRNDPSGCHTQAGTPRSESETHAEEEYGSGGLRCPLYVFAFAAPGDGVRVGATLAQLFDHVWMYPAPTAPASTLVLSQDPASGGGSVSFEHQRLLTSDSAAVAAVEGAEPATQPLHLRLTQSETASPTGRLVAALLASGVRAELAARGVTADSTAPDWTRRDGHIGAVRILDSAQGLDVFSPGNDVCTAAAEGDPCGTLYRLELYPLGAPGWLGELEARDAADAERTFGLGRLFVPFAANPAGTAPLARTYLLVR